MTEIEALGSCVVVESGVLGKGEFSWGCADGVFRSGRLGLGLGLGLVWTGSCMLCVRLKGEEVARVGACTCHDNILGRYVL